MYDTITRGQPKLGLAGISLLAKSVLGIPALLFPALLFFAMPVQAQVTETEMAQINQYYLDAYAIQYATLAAYSDPSADGAVAFEQCVQQVNGLAVPTYMLLAAQAHDFNGYGEASWAGAFCDRVHLNYIFFTDGPKFD